MNNTLKAISRNDDELRVANYIVLFGGEDLHGEHFAPDTKFESSYTKSGILHVDFEHGMDPDDVGMDENEVLGYVDWKTARVDDAGVFVERSLKRQAKYMSRLETLIDAGVIGTSSAAVPGKTKREGGKIVSWPLMRDTLTFTPAEPRMLAGNVLQAAKSLLDDFPNSKSLAVVKDLRDFKSSVEDAETLAECERLLRDVAGLSVGNAKALVSRIRSIACRDGEQKSVLETVREFRANL